MTSITLLFLAACVGPVLTYPTNCLYSTGYAKCVMSGDLKLNGMDRNYLTGPDPPKCNDGSVAGLVLFYSYRKHKIIIFYIYCFMFVYMEYFFTY